MTPPATHQTTSDAHRDIKDVLLEAEPAPKPPVSNERREKQGLSSLEEKDGDRSDDSDIDGLIFNPPKPPKNEPSQNAEYAAFMSWVADANRETASSTLETEGDQVSVTLAEPRVLSTQVITAPREYQTELFERAKEQNTIVVLDTGCGKTFIAVLLLRHMLEQELENRAQGQIRKTAFFLVDKVALCLQQYRFLHANLEFPIAKRYGDGISIEKPEDWQAMAQESMVVVCTAQILLDLLNSGIVAMSQINVLIFDEAHHTKKSHPYAVIVRDHYLRMKGRRPRILGMTASPVDAKTNDLHSAALELEATLCSRLSTVTDEVLHRDMGRKQQIDLIVYYGPPIHTGDSTTALYQSLATLFAYNSSFQSHLNAAKDTYSILGPWAADQYWRPLFEGRRHSLGLAFATDEQISNQLGTPDPQNVDLDDDMIALKAQRLIAEHFERLSTLTAETEAQFSPKLDVLHELLRDAFVSNKTTRCIVFVQKRYIAFLLSEIFQRSAMHISDIATGFLVCRQIY
jgi:endoribonuclease Dicer